MELDKLRDLTNQLHMLTSYPHPTSADWNAAVDKQVKALADEYLKPVTEAATRLLDSIARRCGVQDIDGFRPRMQELAMAVGWKRKKREQLDGTDQRPEVSASKERHTETEG
jgi:hypothetical protein